MTSSEVLSADNPINTSVVNITVVDDTNNDDDEHDAEHSSKNTFEDKTARLAFIQKVLTIKLLQGLGVLIFVTICVVYGWETCRQIGGNSNIEKLLVLSAIAYVWNLALMICCHKVRRSNPCRYIFLVAYPLNCTVLFCGTILWLDKLELSAALYYYWLALAGLLAYSTFACQTEVEFVPRRGILISFLVLIVMFVLTVPFFFPPQTNYVFQALSTMVAGVNLIFLMFNLEWMTSKNYSTDLTPNDFVDGAVNLQIDFYYIFVISLKKIACLTNKRNEPSLEAGDKQVEVTEEAVPVCDENDQLLVNNTFEDDDTRLGFIQKVMAIKFVQLLGTVVLMSICWIDYHNGSIMWRYTYYNQYVIAILILVYVVTFGLMIFCDKARKTNPYRSILLVAYPLSYTLVICFVLTRWERLEVFAAWYYYCIAFFALFVYSVFAFRTKVKFVPRHGIVPGYLIIIGMFALTYRCLYVRNLFYLVYSIIAVGVDLTFFLMNLEKMTTNNYRVTVTPDEFVESALNLDIDYYYLIVNPFVSCDKKYFNESPEHTASLEISSEEADLSCNNKTNESH